MITILTVSGIVLAIGLIALTAFISVRSSKRRAIAILSLGLSLLTLDGFVLSKLISPYWENYMFQDDLDDIARRVSYTQINDEDIRALVLKKAENVGIPLEEGQIFVTRNSDGVALEVRYSVRSLGIPLNFIVRSKNTRV